MHLPFLLRDLHVSARILLITNPYSQPFAHCVSDFGQTDPHSESTIRTRQRIGQTALARNHHEMSKATETLTVRQTIRRNVNVVRLALMTVDVLHLQRNEWMMKRNSNFQ